MTNTHIQQIEKISANDIQRVNIHFAGEMTGVYMKHDKELKELTDGYLKSLVSLLKSRIK